MNLMTKRMIIMLAIVGVVLGLVFGFQIFKGIMIKKYMSGGPPPQTISSIVAKSEDWQTTFSAAGSLRAVRGSDLSFEVAGIVDEIAFQSGDETKAGTPLVKLRAEDDQARLASLEASAALTKSTLERNRKQFEAKAISQAALDVDAANLKTAEAAVAQQRAILNKKTLKAPFGGKLGVRMVDVGQYINPGVAIVTLQQLDPIYADFYVPPQQAAQLTVGMKVAIKTDDSSKSLEGQISAINPKVDSSSRNVLVRASMANPGGKLLPGTPVSLEVFTGKTNHYLTLPNAAVTYNPYGSTVFIVTENGKDEKGQMKHQVHQTFITTGPTRGDQVAVLSGVKEGEVVVSAGQMKIQNGSTVMINNTVQPTSDPAPKPTDK